MLDYRLDKHELAELRAAHRAARDVREAYRINAVILLDKGRAPADVADALLIDPEALITNPPKAGQPMWIFARKTMFCKGAATPGLNKVGGIMIKADPDTARDYFKRYKKGGLDGLLRMSYIGSEALLDDTQLLELDDHLQNHLYLTAEAVARHVQKRWGVRYTPSGMTAVLHRLGYVYKKAKLKPGKHPAPEVQEVFVEK